MGAYDTRVAILVKVMSFFIFYVCDKFDLWRSRKVGVVQHSQCCGYGRDAIVMLSIFVQDYEISSNQPKLDFYIIRSYLDRE